MLDMYSLTFLNNGLYTHFSTQPNSFGQSLDNPFLIQSVTGLSEYDVIIPMTRGFQQYGYSAQNPSAGTRIITVTFYGYLVNGEFGDIRRELCRKLNPNLGMGVLTYSNGTYAENKMIDAICSKMPSVVSVISNNLAIFSVEFTCPNPLWRGQNHTVSDQLPNTASTFTENYNLPNVGDVEAPVTITLSGSAFLGFIKLKDGNNVLHDLRYDARSYDGTVDQQTQVILTSDYGNKNLYISQNGEKELYNRYLTKPDFFSIPVGENTNKPVNTLITMRDAGSVHDRFYITFSWNDWFVGV